MTRGFWGSVAVGARTTMTVMSGRLKPHAAERSKRSLKAHADDLRIAEAVAGVVHDAGEQELAPKAVMEQRRAYWGIIHASPLPLADVDVGLVIAALRREAERWSAVPIDEELTLTWPLCVERVPMSRPATARTGGSHRSRRAR